MLFLSALIRLRLETANGHFENSGVPVALGKTVFYNFTSTHLFVDDDGDWGGDATDLKRIYAACNEQFIYILWIKSCTGSHVDEMYFDVGEKYGYTIGGITATYMFASNGMSKWNGTAFQLLITLNNVDINLWKSDDDQVAHHTWLSVDEPEEYSELKLSWSVFNSSQTIKIVDGIKYSGLDQAPDDTFILIHRNQSQRFIASFCSKTSEFEDRLWEIRKHSISYYSRSIDASLKLMNFGDSDLESLIIHLGLSTGIIANISENAWNITLEPTNYWTLNFNLIPERLGKFNLTAMISCDDAENMISQIIPLNLLVVPKMSIAIEHSEQMKAGFLNELNVTAVNYETINAEVSVETYGQYMEYWYFSPFTLELGRNSSVKIITEIAPLAIINPQLRGDYNYSFLEMALKFENVPICSSGSFPFPSGPVEIIEPNVQIQLQYPKEVVVGDIFYINISATNNEEEEIIVSFNVKASVSSLVPRNHDLSPVFIVEDSDYKKQIGSIPSDSNITISFKFKANEEYPHSAPIDFYVKHGSNGDHFSAEITVVSSFTRLWAVAEYTLVFASISVIVGLGIFYWKRKTRERT
jgi:hypothetical protein